MFKVKEPETSNFKPATVPGRFQSGQMGRTVNPLSFDFRGSNPLLPTSVINCNYKFFGKNRPGQKPGRLQAEVAQLVERQPSKL
jgi:hypothetical protein